MRLFQKPKDELELSNTNFDNSAKLFDNTNNNQTISSNIQTFLQTKRKIIKRLGIAASILVSLAGAYLFFVYTDIPAIANLRTMYIETAMSTMRHQWLATAFFPDSVIDEVMNNVKKQFEDNMVKESELPAVEVVKVEQPVENDYTKFAALFPEINLETLPSDINKDTLMSLQIKNIADKGIKTNAGETLWAIDVPNKLLIVNVSGDGYQGKLAIVKDSSQVFLSHNTLPNRGQTITEQCTSNNAVLGINASGFQDPNGNGMGNIPVGLVKSNNQVINAAVTGQYQIVGYDVDNNLRMGYGLDVSTLRDAAQFYPIIVLNGQNCTDGSYGMGIQPRTAIGQTTDKSTLMLIIDGRQSHSLGTTVSECANILLRYGCYNAMNMDGGSSSSMTYMGEMITKTSSPMKTGRYLPDAWLIKKAGE